MRFDKGYISEVLQLTDPERRGGGPGGPPTSCWSQLKVSTVRICCRCSKIGAGKPLLIIAEDVEGEGAVTWSSTRSAAPFKSVAVRLGSEPPQGDAAGYGHSHRWSR